MKILIVGTFGSPQRDESIARGFRECGVDVAECPYGDIVYDKNIMTRFQLRFSKGPICSILAKRVCKAAACFQPNVIFFRRPLEFNPTMLKYIRRHSHAVLASFNNDDPFSPAYCDQRWRLMREAIPLFDIHFAFRIRNMGQYREHGAKRVALWEPFYSPWLHRPLTNGINVGHSNNEVVFAMHSERDGRREAVLDLLSAGLSVKVYSWNWAQEFGVRDARAVGVMPPVWGEEYVGTVQKAMASLCFFSKQNNDELTSRVFEIPACGGLLVAERNDRISELFSDGKEAVLFSTRKELVRHICELRDSPDLVRRIKIQGYERVLSSSHSVVDRCREALVTLRQVVQETSPRILRPQSGAGFLCQ